MILIMAWFKVLDESMRGIISVFNSIGFDTRPVLNCIYLLDVCDLEQNKVPALFEFTS